MCVGNKQLCAWTRLFWFLIFQNLISIGISWITCEFGGKAFVSVSEDVHIFVVVPRPDDDDDDDDGGDDDNDDDDDNNNEDGDDDEY